MREVVLAAVLLAAGAVVQARPVVIEESQWLAPPNPGYTYLGESVAIDGDWALATALFSADGSYNYPYRQLALLYRRSGSSWVFDRVLVDDPVDAASYNEPRVAMKDGWASVSTSPLRMFRQTTAGDDWVPLTQPFRAEPGALAWANGPTRIDGTTVAAVAGRCNHSVVTSDLIDNGWSPPELLIGNARICTLANTSSALDLDGNRLVFTNPQEDITLPPSATQIYQRNGPGLPWQPEQTLPVADFGAGIALRGGELFIGSMSPHGNEIYRRGENGWAHAGYLPTLRGFNQFHDPAYHIAKNREFVLTSTSTFDGRPAAIAVYRKDADGDYQHVAQLASSRGDSLGPVMEISGRTIVVGGWSLDHPERGLLYFFELPEDLVAPPVIQDDFEDGDAAGWSISSGSMSVSRRGPSRVLRHPLVPGQSLAILSASQMTNQSAQVDVRINAFAGADSWVGVATRYLDGRNFYYAALRGDGVMTLRKLQAGVTTVLAERPLATQPGGRYKLRLESIGSRLRVYVNGQRLADVLDRSLKSGRVALVVSSASVDFDNVVVTPNHRTPLYEAEILNGSDCEALLREQELRATGTPDWDCSVYENGFLRQASIEGVARAAIGPSTDDQSVESRMQLEEFAGTGGQDQWIGVMTRYTDENNYYYFSLRSSKSMSLRKLVDGQITELGHSGFTLGVGDWHTLRLDAVGDQIRAYVDGQLIMQARDTSHPTGISGIVTYRSAARFDYLRVIQP